MGFVHLSVRSLTFWRVILEREKFNTVIINSKHFLTYNYFAILEIIGVQIAS